MDGIFKRLYLNDTFHPDDDIRVFLRDSFEKIKRTHPFKSRLPMVWPTPAAVETIVQKSSGQFIYAATVIRFVQSIRHQPHHQLEKILNLRPLQGDMPFAQLDELYTMILSSVAKIDQVLLAISVYSLRVQEAYAIDLLHYMSLDKEEIEILFCDLGALVSVEWDEIFRTTGLKILHASLHDFLLDPLRSKDFCISLDAYRTQHMTAILQYITTPLLESDDPEFLDELDLNAIKLRLMPTGDFFKQNFPKCESSVQLLHQFFSFPLGQIFGKIQTLEDIDLQPFLCFVFFPFVRRMVILISSSCHFK